LAIGGTRRLRRRTAARLLPEWVGHPATVGAVLVQLVFLAVLGARALGWLQGLELGVHDQYLRLRTASGETDPRIVIVGFDNDDVDRYEHPFGDGLLATALQRLVEAGPMAVGLDLIRPRPMEQGEEGATGGSRRCCASRTRSSA
jgi:CHASE2 domain-containing sensor protein